MRDGYYLFFHMEDHLTEEQKQQWKQVAECHRVVNQYFESRQQINDMWKRGFAWLLFLAPIAIGIGMWLGGRK